MRRTAVVIIDDVQSRDSGKQFLITEMSADQAERWAIRALLAVGRSGIELPENVFSMGFAGIATTGIEAIVKMDYADAAPLLDEIFTCVKIVRDKNHPETTFEVLPGDIEEVATKLKLRKAVWDLHVNFLLPAAPSKSAAPLQAAGTTQNTQTSRPSLEQQSQRVRRPSKNSKRITR